MSSHAMPCHALPCLALPCLALPCLALPCLALSCPVLSCPVQTSLLCSTLPCSVLPCAPHLCYALLHVHSIFLMYTHTHTHTHTHVENTRTAVCEFHLYPTLVPDLMAINNALSIVRTAHEFVFVILLFRLFTISNLVLQLRFFHSFRMGMPMEPVTALQGEE
jgi:hypothetical protein